MKNAVLIWCVLMLPVTHSKDVDCSSGEQTEALEDCSQTFYSTLDIVNNIANNTLKISLACKTPETFITCASAVCTNFMEHLPTKLHDDVHNLRSACVHRTASVKSWLLSAYTGGAARLVTPSILLLLATTILRSTLLG